RGDVREEELPRRPAPGDPAPRARRGDARVGCRQDPRRVTLRAIDRAARSAAKAEREAELREREARARGARSEAGRRPASDEATKRSGLAAAQILRKRRGAPISRGAGRTGRSSLARDLDEAQRLPGVLVGDALSARAARPGLDSLGGRREELRGLPIE